MNLWPNILPREKDQEPCWTCEAPASWVPDYGYLCQDCIERQMESMELWLSGQQEEV